MSNHNKDFYEKIPEQSQEILNILIDEYGEEEWFDEAWERYRSYVLRTDSTNLFPPSYVFTLYIR